MARSTVVAAPYTSAAAITTSDATAIATGITDAVYCGVSGTAVLIDQNGTSISTTLVGGTILPLRVSRINATGTAATGLVALYY